MKNIIHGLSEFLTKLKEGKPIQATEVRRVKTRNGYKVVKKRKWL
jgi:hypothetical protein